MSNPLKPKKLPEGPIQVEPESKGTPSMPHLPPRNKAL